MHTETLDEPTTLHDHTPSVPPMAIATPPFSMASFGIEADPDAAVRRKRGIFFGIFVAAVAAIATFMITRSSPPPVAAQPEPKPVAAAVAPPPAETKLPAPAVAEKKEEPKPAAPVAEEKDTKSKAKAKRRAGAKHAR